MAKRKSSEPERIKIRVWVTSSGSRAKSSKVIELNREYWEAMSKNEREDLCQGETWDLFEWGYEVADDE